MVSKAWYKPSALPQLIARFDSVTTPKRRVEVFTATCIVSNFGKQCGVDGNDDSNHLPQCSVLVNPANPNLTGPNSFAYFPRGGPQPLTKPNRTWNPVGYVSQWGGMDVGSGMLFAAETVDGLVHQLGGIRLRAECSLVPKHQYSYAYINQQSSELDDNVQDKEKRSVKCPVGTAVATSSGGEDLQKHYDTIIHTTPPFYNYPPSITPELKEVLGILDIDSDDEDIHSWSKELLSSCYRQSFKVAFDNDTNNDNSTQNSFINNSLSLFGLNTKQQVKKTGKRVAVPLLGAGCRAFPKEIALDVAAIESASWLSTHSSDTSEQKNTDEDEPDVVVFGLLEEDDARHLSNRLEKELSCVPEQPTPTP